MTVWVTYEPSDDCQCWRDAACTHEWTWQEEASCVHRDAILDDVHASLADAVRSLFSVRGFEVIGRLLRQRYRTDQPSTQTVYVMPRGADITDNHDAYDGPAPLWIIERKVLGGRSRVGDKTRAFADSYRPTAASTADQITEPRTE